MQYFKITHTKTGEIKIVPGLTKRDALRNSGWDGRELRELMVELREPNARVIDLLLGWDDEYVENLPPGARTFDFGGKALYYLVRNYDKDDANPELQPYKRPDKVDVPPEMAYRATRWPETKLLFKHRPTMLEKVNTFAAMGMLGLFALIILIFMGQ
jgi:hypothetical protein